MPFLNLALPIGSGTPAQAQVSRAFDSGHPRIFIPGTAGVTVLEERCGITDHSGGEYQDHATEYAAILAVADIYTAAQIPGLSDDLNKARAGVAAALVYLVAEGIGSPSTYFDKAKAFLDDVNNFGTDDKAHYALMYACMVYDWIYNDLSGPERSTAVSEINSYITGSSYYSTYNSFDPYYHDRKYPSSLFSLSGSAIYDEDSTSANTYVDRGLTAYSRLMDRQQEIANSGWGYSIGQVSYYDESGTQPPLRLYGGYNLGGMSGTDVTGMAGGGYEDTIINMLYGELYMLTEWGKKLTLNDTARDAAGIIANSRGPEGPFYVSMVGSLKDGETLGIIANALQQGYSETGTAVTFTDIGSILFVDRQTNAIGTTITNLPLIRLFGNEGFVRRDGWDLDGTSTDVIIVCPTEKHVNGHTHFCKGQFLIQRGQDALIIKPGDYTSSVNNPNVAGHYQYSDQESSTLNVYDSSEDCGDAPEGGQLSNRGDGAVNRNDGSAEHGSSEWAEIGHASSGGTSFCGETVYQDGSAANAWAVNASNFAPAYKPSKVDDYQRIRATLDNFLIVVDRLDGVSSSHPRYTKQYSIGLPTITDGGSWDGGTARDGNGGTPGETSSDAKQLTVSDGSSKCFIENIFPTSTTMRRIGGSDDYRWYCPHQAVNYNNLDTNGTANGDWRLDIIDDSGNTDSVWLTVFYPVASAGTMPTVTSLGAVGSGNFIGCYIADTSDTLVFVCSNDVTNGTETGYTFTVTSASNPRRGVLCDCTNGTWSLTLDTVEQGPFTVSNNVLYFDIGSGGTGAIVATRTGA